MGQPFVHKSPIPGLGLSAGITLSMLSLMVLLPIAAAFQWDLTWFGVVLTMMIAIGQFTPPMAVNLMVSCRIAGVSMESTVPWVIWLVLAMLLSAVAVMAVPGMESTKSTEPAR